MGRYLSGIIALAAAAGAYFYNQSHQDSQVILIGLNLIFGEDPKVLSERTWQVLAAIGVIWLGLDLMRALRRPAMKKDQDE